MAFPCRSNKPKYVRETHSSGAAEAGLPVALRGAGAPSVLDGDPVDVARLGPDRHAAGFGRDDVVREDVEKEGEGFGGQAHGGSFRV